MSEQFIYNPIQKSAEKQNDKFYGAIQDYDFIDSDNNPRINTESDKRVLAKIKYRTNNKEKYLIKIDNTKKMFNPLSPLSENKNNKLLDQYAANSDTFTEVSRKAFDYYLTFLRTSNPSWIHNAEREIY